MGKDKKEKRQSDVNDETEKEESWEEKTKYLCSIAKPLATKKLTKRLYKTIRKASKQKNFLRKGVREVQKFIRKGEKGIVVLAGDVSPLDVISHMPVVCEDADIPYCYAPSKDDLGSACGSKRPTCMVLVKTHTDYKDYFDECVAGVKELPLPY
ncbi:hypothetical protein C0Q70_09344 [Pomacea canaliculata]|uniref:H/ACA ribonucleoprotein complex subunit 2 n=1 Tax=Pomacea canaliculata TaxID=400727 RepID=A0A2T7P9I9_POMCA|nr:H/ACA ribonucleoprotein complex subunit 2-like protein [Pomacea canaliculata]PVD30083.1 hypothetical protein C0Q70_09344 [Pomacea canaliculata]